jgi:hypothetical protein
MYLIPGNYRDESNKSWDGRPMKSSKTENVVKEFEPLKKLIQVTQDDRVINDKVIKMLQMDLFHRRAVLNNRLEHLQHHNAPENLLSALSCLFDDKVAEKVPSLINKDQIVKKGPQSLQPGYNDKLSIINDQCCRIEYLQSSRAKGCHSG